MISTLLIPLLLQAATPDNGLLSLGTSPLVEKGHKHDWIEIGGQFESNWPEDKRIYDEKWYYDQAWAANLEQDGRELSLILIRSAVDDEEDPMKIDAILAVGCERQELGMKEGFAFVAPINEGKLIKNGPIEMHPLGDDPLIKDSSRLLEMVCGKTSAQ